MKIAILGGTGRIGEGLATRWATRHNIYIGSRELDLIECLRPVLKNQILISLVVPMKKENGSFEYTPPEEGCAALRIQHLLPGVKVVSAYHNLSYRKLCNPDKYG
ncbi:MAG: NAD(P)-binding domain-containing protein [Candidatus Methanoperedens sp.]